MGSLLALDFGERRTGIAHTDSLQIIASGLTTLSPEKTIIFLKDYKLKNDLDAVIIGQSKKSDGSYPIIEKKNFKFYFKIKE